MENAKNWIAKLRDKRAIVAVVEVSSYVRIIKIIKQTTGYILHITDQLKETGNRKDLDRQ